MKRRRGQSGRGFKRRRTIGRIVKAIVRKSTETSSILANFSATDIPAGAASSGSNDVHLTAIQQGTGEGERIKNEIRVTGVYGELFITGAAADTTNGYRLVMYVPKDKNVTLSNSPALNYNAAPDLDSHTILKDWLVCTSTTGPACRRLVVKFKFKGNGMRVGYTGAGVGTVSQHPLYFYFVSDSSASPLPKLNGYLRLYYKDG